MAATTSSFAGLPATTGGATGRSKRFGPVLSSPDQHRRRVQIRCDLRRDQGEFVVQVARVLDQAHHDPAGAAELHGGIEPGPQCFRCTVGHRHLVVCTRIAPLDESEHRSAQRAIGILRAQLDRVEQAGDRGVPAPDEVDRVEPLTGGRDVDRQRLRLRLLEFE